MDVFQNEFLRTLVAEFDKLSEREKAAGGVETRVLARALAPDLSIEASFVDSSEYHGSEQFVRILNTCDQLEEEGLIKASRRISGIAWVSPTSYGRSVVHQREEEQRSPVIQGKRIVKHLCDLQGNLSPVDRQVGRAGQIDVNELCSDLDIAYDMYLRAVRWAERQEYIAEPSVDQYTVENGGIYITDKGIDAADNDFQTDQGVSGPTINIQDSQVYGNILAAGRDAMVITSPALAENTEEVRSLLAKIQAAAESLPEDSDQRHDTFQELESLQREFSKDAPLRGRIERSVNFIGSIASIGTMAAPQVARLLELAGQLPGM